MSQNNYTLLVGGQPMGYFGTYTEANKAGQALKQNNLARTFRIILRKTNTRLLPLTTK